MATKKAEKKEEVKVAAPAVEVKAEAKEAPKAEAKAPVKAEVKAPVKAEAKAAVKAPAKAKAPAKKAAKAPAKKTAAKAPAAKKAAKAAVYIQYAGFEKSVDEIVEAAKKAATVAVKDVAVYVKPEENAAYYVINGGEETGKIGL